MVVIHKSYAWTHDTKRVNTCNIRKENYMQRKIQLLVLSFYMGHPTCTSK